MQPITKWNQNMWTKNLKQERFRHNADWYMLCGIRQHAVIFTHIHRKKAIVTKFEIFKSPYLDKDL